MDTAIKKISEIESAAAAIMDDANARKEGFAAEMAAKSTAFDRQLESETAAKLAGLRARMATETDQELEQLASYAKAMEAAWEQHYRERHVSYVDDLFQSLTKE